MQKDNLINVLNGADVLYQNKDDIISLLDYMNICLFKKGFLNIVSYVEEAKKKISSNNNYEMTIDNLLIKSWKSINRKE